MLDSQLQALIVQVMTAGLAARGVTAAVKQNNQPRQFVAPSSPMVFFTMGGRKKYGWPVARDVLNNDGLAFTTSTTQIVHTRFQIAGFAPNPSPATPYALTSGDLTSIANDILQHESAVAAYLAADCNVFRVSDNPAIWFQDSNAQNVEWASFDIIFTHKDVFATSTAPISDFNGTFDRV